MDYSLEVVARFDGGLSVWIDAEVSTGQGQYNMFELHRYFPKMADAEMFTMNPGIMLNDEVPDSLVPCVTTTNPILGVSEVTGVEYKWEWEDIDFDSIEEMVKDVLGDKEWTKHGSQFENDTMDWDDVDQCAVSIIPHIFEQWGEDDTDALRQGINDYVDGLGRDNQISSWTAYNWDYNENQLVKMARTQGLLRVKGLLQ